MELPTALLIQQTRRRQIPHIDPADLSVFVDAIARHDPRIANVHFDICGVAGVGQWKEKKARISERIRQIGIRRMLWGSDGAFGAGMTPAQALQAYRELPLTKEEFHTIDTNLAPDMR